MKQVVGDIWQYTENNDVDALCVLTNMTVSAGRLIMGGGQAREARERFPYLPEEWGKFYDEEGDGQVTLFDPLQGFILVSLPTKRHPSDDSTVEMIVTSLRELVDFANLEGWAEIVLPKPGCGLGGLTWDVVGPAIEPLLDDRFTVISNV